MTANATNCDAIALRAYLIWNDEGRPHGRHEHHWFTAEAAEALAATASQVPAVEAVAAPAPVVKAIPAKRGIPAKKAATDKPAAKKVATAKAGLPKGLAETVVAGAALAAPRAARSAAKGASRPH